MNDDSTALRRIGGLLRLVEGLESHQDGKYFDLSRTGSDLESDDSKLEYLKTSHLIGHSLSVSLDALRTARLILQSSDEDRQLRIPMMGHYAVLRSALESSALATWLLIPEEQTTRLERSLQARMSEVLHDDQLAQIITESEDDDDKEKRARNARGRRENSQTIRARKLMLRKLGAANEIAEQKLNQGAPGFGPIIGASAPAINMRSSETRSFWHLISGLTHPSVSRSVAFSNIEYVGGENSDNAFTSANLDYVVSSLSIACQFHIAALNLVAQRGNNESMRYSIG